MTVSIVEFGSGNGHQPHYLKLIADAWRRSPRGEKLVISVRRILMERHPEVTTFAGGSDEVDLVALEEEADVRIDWAFANFKAPLESILPGGVADPSVSALWEGAQAEAARHKARKLLLLEIDRCLPALAGMLPSACPVSGIWFKPRFHYGELGWQGQESAGFGLAERLMLKRALTNPHLQCLMTLDPFAVEAAARLSPDGGKVRRLVDPAAVPDTASMAKSVARRLLGIPEDRFTVLHFGEVGPRKGVTELSEGFALLPEQLAARASLIIAGPPLNLDPAAFDALLHHVRARGSVVLFRPEFVPDDIAGLYFAATDVVSLAYNRQAGMSGVLLTAASAGRPVLSQPEGLIGALTREHSLGVTLLDRRPASIASMLATFVADGGVAGFNLDKATAFALSHDPRHFQATILTALTED